MAFIPPSLLGAYNGTTGLAWELVDGGVALERVPSLGTDHGRVPIDRHGNPKLTICLPRELGRFKPSRGVALVDGGIALSIPYFMDLPLRVWAEGRVYGPLADGGFRSLSRLLFLLGPYLFVLGLRIVLAKARTRNGEEHKA